MVGSMVRLFYLSKKLMVCISTFHVLVVRPGLLNTDHHSFQILLLILLEKTTSQLVCRVDEVSAGLVHLRIA